MKKALIGPLAVLAATLGMGATPQSGPVNQNQSQSQSQNQRHNDALEKQITTVRRGPVTALNPAGLGDYGLFKTSGMKPKEYGQYLQAHGRQKWVKAKNRK